MSNDNFLERGLKPQLTGVDLDANEGPLPPANPFSDNSSEPQFDSDKDIHDVEDGKRSLGHISKKSSTAAARGMIMQAFGRLYTSRKGLKQGPLKDIERTQRKRAAKKKPNDAKPRSEIESYNEDETLQNGKLTSQQATDSFTNINNPILESPSLRNIMREKRKEKVELPIKGVSDNKLSQHPSSTALDAYSQKNVVVKTGRSCLPCF